ncbi:MAG: type II toxin-antitoxin system HipA family toxin [Candidatus Riflebacteria bacterium]|nr:type II toxin-antitoxin system HipA family toxin [Candidatus Riflebacteria bacterium]
MKRSSVNVFVSGARAGIISRSGLEDDTFLFSYDGDCPESHAVSLTMPVVSDQYDSMNTIHPVFEMNLPEGFLRKKLELMFSKVMKHFDSLSLLEIVGKSQIGRLRFSSEDSILGEVPAQNIKSLLSYKGTEDLFEDLVNRFATSSGISGVQPKVLIRSEVAGIGRITDKGATHIVKSFDPREYPELAANEFFSMAAARYSGLETAQTRLSLNRKLLIVKRFDREKNGAWLGFEDFCVLSGMRSDGRYLSSYERLAQQISRYVSPQHLLNSLEQFFGAIVLACGIRNGDAHLKNFGVLYRTPEKTVRLAPVYDMLSTKLYFPHDVLALELNGSKNFPSREQLIRFGRQACGLSSRKTQEIIENVTSGIDQATKELRNFSEKNKTSRKFADRLIGIYSEGRESIAKGA